MLGRFLQKLGWHKKPVTHAATLWALVAFAAFLLIVFFSYSKELTSIKEGVREAKATKVRTQVSLPAVFGTVLSFDGRMIEVESKQNFSRIMTDDVTSVTDINGDAYTLSHVKPGATVMATGKSIDADTLVADALVILTEGE